MSSWPSCGPDTLDPSSGKAGQSSSRSGLICPQEKWGNRRKALCFLGALLHKSYRTTNHTEDSQPGMAGVRGRDKVCLLLPPLGAELGGNSATLVTPLRHVKEMYPCDWPQESHHGHIKACQQSSILNGQVM